MTLNIILVSLGIICFIYSTTVYQKLLCLIFKTKFKKWWVILISLIILFTIGYILFAYILITQRQINTLLPLETIVSLIFFFGAVFVVLTARLSFSTLIELKIGNLKIKNFSAKLKRNEDNLEKKVTERTAELEKTNKLMIGRELKMIDLKKENKKLKNDLNYKTKNNES